MIARLKAGSAVVGLLGLMCAQTVISAQTTSREGNSGRNSHPRGIDGTHKLKRKPLDLARPNLRTIPFWQDSFDYRGLHYSYKMVGTDPKRGSATTVVPVVLVPIRWIFSSGEIRDSSTDLVDGRTAIQGILASPVFQDYPFVSGGTPVGTTQFADAFQRANFWNSVSTRAPNYHVRLAAPTVLPTQVVHVPADKVTYLTNEATGVVTPLVDDRFLEDLQMNVIASLGISPATLPIIVWGSVAAQDGPLAWHGAYQDGDALHTFIATGYASVTQYTGLFPDVSALGHEVIEWLDDPFGDNYSAGWMFPFYEYDPPPPHNRCDSASVAQGLLETADPFENLGEFTNTPVVLNGYTYHLPEGAFIDFFTRNSHSRSVNGQYSFFEIARPFGFDTPPSDDCVGSVHSDNTFFAVPGADNTYPLGINDEGDVVGYFTDSAGTHGFIRSRGYQRVDYPGAAATVLTGTNNRGDVVGYFIDANGYPQGFLFRNGRFNPVNVPGHVDTLPNGINDAGEIVGEYDVTQPITHGFILKNGRFDSVSTPFGTQSAVTGINEAGATAGTAWSDPTGSESGWTKNASGFRRFDFPDASSTALTSINRFAETSGYYLDGNGYAHGMVTLLGYPYESADVYVVLGMNGKRQIVGRGFNFATGRFEALIGSEPLQDDGRSDARTGRNR